MSDEPVPRSVPRTVVAPPGWESLLDRARTLRGDPRVAVAALVVAAVAAGLIWYRIGLGGGHGESGPVRAPQVRSEATKPSSRRPAGSASTSTTVTPATPPAGELVVHVSGAVIREGLVRLPAGARVADAVAAAGGASPDADLRRLNLAAKVVDGQQVAVTKVGEPPPQVASPSGSAPAPSSGTPLDLNAATETQLEALPGIGPSLPRAIVAERERSGGFRTVDDLRRVRGIGDSRFAQIRSLVRV